MIRGLFLPWFVSQVAQPKYLDDFLRFASEAGITDLYIGAGKDSRKVQEFRRDNIGYDPLKYVCENRDKMNVHAHISTLLLWQQKNYLPDTLPTEWMYFNGRNCCWELDALNLEVQAYLVRKCADLVRDYDIQGIYLERLYYHSARAGPKQWPLATEEADILAELEDKRIALDAVVEGVSRECRHVKRDIKITSSTWYLELKRGYDWNDKLQNWEKWLDNGWIDYAAPMLFSRDQDVYSRAMNYYQNHRNRDRILLTMGCFNKPLSDTNYQKEQVTVMGGVLYFGYHRFSSLPAEKLEDFKMVISSAVH